MTDLNIEAIENDLGRSFWTVREEMIKEIEDKGYPVEADYGEFLVIRESEDEASTEYVLRVGKANHTLWIEKIEEA